VDARREREVGGQATTDAAQAFEALRAEVALQRRAVEALGDALEAQAPPDLSIDIARIVKGQAQLLEAMQGLQKLQYHSVLRMTPAEHGQAIINAGADAVRETAGQLRQATQSLENEGRRLARLVGAGVANSRQRQVLLWATGAALAAGLLLSPVLVRSLPVELSSRAAAFVVKEDRWQAGEALMRLADPGQWSSAIEAIGLARANQATLSACRSQATRTGREQRCAIVVPAQ
jgi:Family of unknown function (DUF6118)